jgi:hypothetical protein
MTERLQQSDSNNNKQVINMDFLDREANLYRTSKEILKTNTETIDKAIKDNTKQEVEAVQNAIKTLNDKVDKLMETDFVKDKQKQIDSSQKQMSESIKKASDAFFKVKTYILEKEGLTDEQKQQYIKKLYDKLMDKFMTKEEKMFFERLISGGGGLIIMDGGGMRMGGMGGMGGGLKQLGF